MNSTALSPIPTIPASALTPLVDALWPEILSRLDRLGLVPTTPKSAQASVGRVVVPISVAAVLMGKTEKQLNDLISDERMPVLDLFAGKRTRRLRAIYRPWCDQAESLKRGGLLPAPHRGDIDFGHLPALMGAAQVAAELGIARSTVHVLVKQGVIPGTSSTPNGCQVRRADLEDYIFDRVFETAFYWNTERGG